MKHFLSNPNCKRCPLNEGVNTVCISGEGDSSPDILFIGEAPGKEEDVLGRPFVGRSGQYLRAFLESLDVTWRVTNIVRCRPPENRTPTKKEIKSCMIYLISEIKLCSPKVIVLLGDTAIKVFMPKGSRSVSKIRGRVEKVGDTYLIPTFHPARKLYGMDLEPIYKEDFQLAERCANGEYGRTDDVDYRFIKTDKDIIDMIEEFKDKDIISIDYETSPDANLYQRKDRKVLSCAFSHQENQSWFLPIYHRESPFKDKPLSEFQKIFDKILKGKNIIGQLAKFEYECCDAFKLIDPDSFKIIWDTCYGAYLQNELEPHTLEYQTEKRGILPGFKDETKGYLRDDINFDEMPLDVVFRRNAPDSDTTLRLANLQSEELPDKHIWVMNNLMLPGIPALASIEKNGIVIDKEALAEAEQIVTKQIIEMNNELHKDKFIQAILDMEGKNREFNVKSPDQVGALLELLKKCNYIGSDQIVFTKKGAISTAEGVLENIDVPCVTQILALRKKRDLLSKYILSIPNHISEIDGRVHPKYSLHIARTGRRTCKEPNAQQIIDDPIIQKIYTVPKGKLMMGADYSQIELRMLAHITQDKGLMEIYKEGYDLHEETRKALEMEKRVDAKGVNFEMVYSFREEAIRSLAKKLNLTEKQSRLFVERWFIRFPDVEPWQIQQVEYVEKHKEFDTIFGRTLRIPEIDSPIKSIRNHARRQSINFPIQSPATGDIPLRAMIEMYKSVKLIIDIHDGLYVEVEDDMNMVRETARYMKQVMEGLELPFKFSVPIIVDFKIGRNFAEMEELKI